MREYVMLGIIFMMTLDFISHNKGLPLLNFLSRFIIVLLWPLALTIFLKGFFDSNN